MFGIGTGQEVAWVVQAGMGLSLLCFYLAWFLRHRLNLHISFAVTGVILNLIASVFLVLSVHLYSVEVTSRYPEWVVLTHRALATVTAGLMITMLVTGISRRRDLHVRLHRVFLLSYTVIFISGHMIFVR